MKLWYLSRIVIRVERGAFRSMMVLARDQAEARQLAAVACGKEGKEAWTDSEKSVCLQDDTTAHVLARTQ